MITAADLNSYCGLHPLDVEYLCSDGRRNRTLYREGHVVLRAARALRHCRDMTARYWRGLDHAAGVSQAAYDRIFIGIFGERNLVRVGSPVEGV